MISLLPIRENGTEGWWQWTTETFNQRLSQGRVKVGGNLSRGYTIYILKDGEYAKIQRGEFEEIGRGINNETLVNDIDTEHVLAIPGDIWHIALHDSTQYGSRLLNSFFNSSRFSFPKSLYAEKDTIRFCVANKPNALILDFFAGSGTTLHAVNLLNAEDGGHRRCILVTNNEVSADEAKSLTAKGYHPGDPEWDKLGIARYVTWPRTTCSIKGVDINGEPLKGTYLGGDPDNPRQMSEGFAANVIFFKLGFLDKTAVALGRQFKQLLPVLWMKAGAHGPCPTLEEDQPPEMLILPENQFAVLADESYYEEFASAVNQDRKIKTVFIVTDSEPGYRDMIRGLKVRDTYQLYRDYLDNFRINTGNK